jgi:hypothetical protein
MLPYLCLGSRRAVSSLLTLSYASTNGYRATVVQRYRTDAVLLRLGWCDAPTASFLYISRALLLFVRPYHATRIRPIPWMKALGLMNVPTCSPPTSYLPPLLRVNIPEEGNDDADDHDDSLILQSNLGTNKEEKTLLEDDWFLKWKNIQLAGLLPHQVTQMYKELGIQPKPHHSHRERINHLRRFRNWVKGSRPKYEKLQDSLNKEERELYQKHTIHELQTICEWYGFPRRGCKNELARRVYRKRKSITTEELALLEMYNKEVLHLCTKFGIKTEGSKLSMVRRLSKCHRAIQKINVTMAQRLDVDVDAARLHFESIPTWKEQLYFYDRSSLRSICAQIGVRHNRKWKNRKLIKKICQHLNLDWTQFGGPFDLQERRYFGSTNFDEDD